MNRATELRLEHLNMRYGDSYLRTAVGTPCKFIEAYPDDEDGDDDSISIRIRKANRNTTYTVVEDLVFNPWGHHLTLYLPKWKGCLVVEKTNAAQIKRGVQSRTTSIIYDIRSPLVNHDRATFWFDVVRAMASPIFFDLATAYDAMTEDNTIMSMPISANACMLYDGTIMYHGAIIGKVDDIEGSKWWPLINKEAAQ